MSLLKTGKITLFVFALMFAFTACENGLIGELTDPTINNNGNNQASIFDGNDDFDLSECIEFVYPINLTAEDGSNITVNNDDELILAFKSADDDALPAFVMPVQILDDDGNLQTLNSEDEIWEIIEECIEEHCGCDDGEDELCFDINFPVTLILPDSSTVSVNNWDELETTVDNYYMNNPNDDDLDFSFVYPISVTMLEDGTIKNINNDDELEDLFEECWGDDFDDCFDIQYPISLNMPDGSTLTAHSEMELDSLYEAWEQANPNATTEPTLVFPITVVYDDGTTKTVNSDDELEELFEECYGDDWDDCGKIKASDATLGTKSTIGKRAVVKIDYLKKKAANSKID